MTVLFDEDSGTSPRASYTNGQLTITRTGVTAWSDLEAFAEELMPSYPSFGGGSITVGAPLPGNPFMRVSGFVADPLGAATSGVSAGGSFLTDILSYDKVRWAITYSRYPYATDDDEKTEDGDPVTNLSHEWICGGEVLTLPSTGLTWADLAADPVPSDLNAGMLIPTIEHSMTWHKVKHPPFEAIRRCIGRVNQARMDFSTGEIFIETLLFLGAQLSRDVMSDGSRAWKVGYKFSERKVKADDVDGSGAGWADEEDGQHIGGWNHFWNPQEGGFFRLIKANAERIYISDDLGDLFVEDTP